MGWRAFERVLTPDEVAAVANDLGSFAPDDDTIAAAAYRFGEVDYVRHYLDDARGFTRDLADAGHALMYMIG